MKAIFVRVDNNATTEEFDTEPTGRQVYITRIVIYVM